MACGFYQHGDRAAAYDDDNAASVLGDAAMMLSSLLQEESACDPTCCIAPRKQLRSNACFVQIGPERRCHGIDFAVGAAGSLTLDGNQFAIQLPKPKSQQVDRAACAEEDAQGFCELCVLSVLRSAQRPPGAALVEESAARCAMRRVWLAVLCSQNDFEAYWLSALSYHKDLFSAIVAHSATFIQY
eukprot:749275-Rhodomonas_salina.4